MTRHTILINKTLQEQRGCIAYKWDCGGFPREVNVAVDLKDELDLREDQSPFKAEGTEKLKVKGMATFLGLGSAAA